MNKLLLIILLGIQSFSMKIDVTHELQKCSNIKYHPSRLMCFDTLVRNITPLSEFETLGSDLTKECSHCHGAKYELSTIAGKKPVSKMSINEIKIALYGYKNGTYGGKDSYTMENLIKQFTKDEIETIIEYIQFKRDKNK